MRRIRSWSGDAWRDLARESRAHCRGGNKEDASVCGSVPGRNARSSAHSTRRTHDYGGARGTVSDRRPSWWPEGLDPARSGSCRGQDPAGEETRSNLGKEAHRHVENAARSIRRMRVLHGSWLPTLDASRTLAV